MLTLNLEEPKKMSPEVELLLCCARTSMDSEINERVRALLREYIDWEYLIEISSLHGMKPLLYWHLKNISTDFVPKTIAKDLKDHYLNTTKINEFLASELIKVLNLFKDHEIPALTFKGPILAASVYGNLSLRQFGDIDVLIHKRNVPKAKDLLISEGFESYKNIQLTGAEEASFLQATEELDLLGRKSDDDIEDIPCWVDLHWAVKGAAEYYLPLDVDDFWGNLEEVPLAGTTAQGFSAEDTLITLCIHGTKTLWTLFWKPLSLICDIAELVRVHPEIDLGRVIEHAGRLGCERIVALGLFLANDILGASLPKEVLQRVQADPVVRYFATLVKRHMLFQTHTGTASMEECTDINHIDLDLIQEINPSVDLFVMHVNNLIDAITFGVTVPWKDKQIYSSDIIDCAQELNRHREFIGRDWLTRRVQEFVGRCNSGFLLLTAEPGIGKSAFVANQVSSNKQRSVFHFIRNDMGYWDDPDSILRSLIGQLRHKYNLPEIDSEQRMTPKVAFLAMLRLVSNGLNGQKEVIYLDGLDEAFGSGGRFTQITLSDFLPRDDGPILPNGIFIVLTSRPGNHLKWLMDLKLCEVETLDPNAQDNKDDIHTYVCHKNQVGNLGLTESFIEYLVDACEGIFAVALIYLRMHPDLSKELTRQRDPSIIPRGLADWFVKQWTHVVTAAQQQGIDQNVVRGILGLMTVAREPLAKEHLIEFLSLKKGTPSVGFLNLEKMAPDLDKVLNLSQEFFDSPSMKQDEVKYYRFFHSSLSEFITADLSEEERSDCHRLFAEKCEAWNQFQGAIRKYALRYRLSHLIAAEEWGQLAKAFAETDFIVERNKKFGFAEIYSDANFMMHDSRIPQDLYEAFREWERFLRRRIEQFRDFPEAYLQEIINEFLPLASKPFASVFKLVKDTFLPPSSFCQKIFGPPAIRGTGHRDQISSVAFSNDEKFIATGSRDSTVKVWEIATGLLIANLIKDNKEPVLCIAFSLDAKFIAMQSADGAVKVWDVQTGVLVSSCVGLSGWDVNMAFSPDGRFVAAGNSAGLVKICEAQTGRLIGECVGHKANISCTVFSHSGKYVASGSCDSTVKIWEVETGKLVADCIGHRDWVNAVVFSPDEKLVASGSNDKTVKVWEVETGQLIGDCVGHNDSVFSVTFSQDGQFIVSGSKDKTVKVWEAKTGRVVANCLGHTDWVLSVDSAKDFVTSGSRDNTIKVWEAKTGHLVADCIGHKDMVFSVNFSQDGQFVASGSWDDTVKVWEVESGKLAKDLAVRQGDDNVSCVAFSHDAKLVATGDKDGMVKVEETRNRQRLSNCIGHEGTVNDIVFSPDGRFIGSGGDDGTVKVWETHTGQLIIDCVGHPDWVFSVDFSHDGKYVASGSWDNTVKIWETQTGKRVVDCIGHEGKVTSVAFSADGRFLVSGSDDRKVKICDIVTGRLVSDFVGHKDSVNTVAFSPDGKFIASGSRDNTVKIWEVATQKVVADCIEHKDHVNTVAFSADGSFVASGSKDRSVKIWKDLEGLCINTLFFDYPLIKVGFTAIPTRSLLVADLKGQIFGYEITI